MQHTSSHFRTCVDGRSERVPRTSPADERGFIHKRGSFLRRIGRKVVGGIPVVGGLVETIGEGVGVFEGRRRIPSAGAFPVQRGCPAGFVRNAQGNCVPPGFTGAVFAGEAKRFFEGTLPPTITSAASRLTGEEGQLLTFGEAKMGRFGAGLKPAVFSQQQRRCPRGSVLGAPEADGTSLCYNRRDISNKERMWPRGRRPLLTGGEMRAISIAASAAKKMQAKQKQLQELGLLKKPTSRPRAPKQLAPGHHAHVAHN